MNYYEHHLGDWAAATGHLTWDEDMAYTRLLRAYYHTERAIPEGQQYRLAKASTPAQRRAVDAVLIEFFELRDGAFHQKRADAEIARFQDKQRKASASANARWGAQRSQSEGNANASPNAMRTHSEGNAHQTPDTRHQTPELNTAPTPDGVGGRPSPDDPPERPALTLVGTPDRPYEAPDCPHLAVLALWAEMLPAMPQHEAEQWKGARADHLRTRWRETAVAKRWQSQVDGLAYLRKFFAYVGQSRFLTGRVPSRDVNRPPFNVTLAWLVRPTNWAEVIEGKYHQEAA